MTKRPFLTVVLCIFALNFFEGTVIAAVAKDVSPLSASKESKTETKLVDINSATKAQLMALPGITEDYADKIIDKRPFYVKTQLRKKEIIPAEVFYGIVDKIDVLAVKPEPKQVAKVKTQSKKLKKKTKPKTVEEKN